MPTNSEKQWDKDTGGDLTAEQVQRNLTIAALDDGVKLILKLMDSLAVIEYESRGEIDFRNFIHNHFSKNPRGWLRAIHQHLLDIKQEYEREEP